MFKLIILQVLVIVLSINTTNSNTTSNTCILPQFPENGFYFIPGEPNASPGQTFTDISLNYFCRSGFKLMGPAFAVCTNGLWNRADQPKCLSQCILSMEPSVTYLCLKQGSLAAAVECDEFVDEGTTVKPKCRNAFYYSSGELTDMRCESGVWNYVATCIPECGVVTKEPHRQIGRQDVNYGSAPWHAGVYYKVKEPYRQVCGGSIISSNVVISAAHCFWREKSQQRPASEFSVAAGKLFRHWNSPLDNNAQQSDVLEIRLPPRFTGMKTYYRDDIAVLTVTTQFKFDKYVRPVCIDFNKNFDKDQLSSGNLGTIASWGRSAQFGIEEPWQFLREVSLPYVDVEQCLIKSSDMRNYITADKFCAYYNETARELCQGDTGGGLTFPAQSRGRERYFLRGVASTARGDKQYCVMFTTFTKVSWHEQFINQYYAPQKYKCVLPPYPDHGSYTTNMNNAKPGEAYDFTAINVVCEQGYDRTGPSWVFCYNGLWPEQMPQCVAPCRLPQNLSVNYRCVVSGSATNEVRRCNEFEPPGTIVIPQCLLPQYYTPTTLSNMRCVNGGWDYTPKCTEMCLLFPHFSVDYRCLTPGSGNDTRICNEYEPPGTVVKSKCRLNYHSPADLTDMECVEGKWNHITICSAHCYLAKHASVQYGCFIEDTGRTSYCYEYLPSGTVVSAHCRAPYYYSTSVLPFMKCNDGYWNYIARCSPVCGMEYLNGPKVVLGGQSTKRGEAPWHATIYFIKNITEYEVKCGGSIITNSIILTAAHCFWDDGRSKVLPSSDFFVAAGMLYSNELNNEETVQQSGVKEIHIPDSFQGSATSYFNDIAAVILNTAFEYKTYVRPICIDFDDSKEKKLLQPGTLGKVAGWSLGKRGEKKAGVSVSNVRFILKIAEIPFVNVEECSKNSPRSFYEYITSDKYCARSANDAGPVYMCEGDTGGGWAFPISDNGVKQYYLRGIASRTNGNKSDKCGLYNYTTFTRLLNHEHFIKRVLATEL